MKQNTVRKRLSTLALALLMVLSMAVPAWAADAPKAPYQITIKPNQYVSTPDDAGVSNESDLKESLATRFWAYQIFTGTLGDGYQSGDKKVNQLSDVKWGGSVRDKEALVAALKADTTPAADMGVTFDRMLATDTTYLDTPALSHYAGAYNAEENWEEGDVGVELTEEGKAALRAAFNSDIGTLTLGHLFTTGLSTTTSADEAAAHVAKVISDFTPATGNTALAKWFAETVADRTAYDTSEGTYKYLKTSGGKANGSSSDNKYEGAYAVSTWNSGTGKQPLNGTWTIGESKTSANTDNLAAGYYLIRDVYQENYWYGGDAEAPEDATESLGRSNFEYIVAVFGDSTVTAKANAPTASKTIQKGGQNMGRADDLEIGEDITFLLTGRLPENYETAYTGYPYIFTDTMDDGLTYDDITRVYVRIPNEESGALGAEGYKYDIYVLDAGTLSGLYPETGAQNLKRYIPEQSGNTLTVTFPTLKALSGKKVVTAPWTTGSDEVQVPVTSDSIVYVEYTATLGEKATVASLTGNRNKVELNYANDPNWDPAVKVVNGTWLKDWDKAPTGKTTAVIASAFDFGIQIQKQDERSEPLEGAAFALKKIEHTGEPAPEGTDTTYYAILHQVKTAAAVGAPNPAPAQYTYYLTGWVTKIDLDSYFSNNTKTWSDKLIAEEEIGDYQVPKTGDYYVSVLTQFDGRVRIEGLSSDATYYLEEVITPDDYDTAGDVSVQFDATYNGSRLKSLTATVGGDTVYTLVEDGAWPDARPTGELVAKFNVINTPSGFLPGTGGVGVYFFYIGGSALLVGAVVLLVLSNGKKKPGAEVR